MEENPQNRKSNKSLIIIIIILVILVLGLVGYIAYDKGLILSSKNEIKENNAQNDQKDNNNETKIEELSISDAEKIFEENMISLTKEHTYPTISFDIKDITNIELISLIFEMDKVNYCIAANEDLKSTITLEEINSYLDKIIPNHKNLTLEDLKVNGAEVSLTMADYQYTDDYGIKFIEDKIYLIGSCHGNIDPFGEVINTKTIKGTKENYVIIIYRKVAFGKYNPTKSSENSTDIYYDYYNNYNMTGEVVESLSIKEEDLGDIDKFKVDYNKYNTYKYIFLEKDGTYQLQSIEVE